MPGGGRGDNAIPLAPGHIAANNSSAKAALLGLTKSWAKEFAPFDIKVNAVAQGLIETDMTMTRAGRDPSRFAERAKTIPLQRAGVPMDVSCAVVWLASDEADYVTGQVISPDGGWFIVGILGHLRKPATAARHPSRNLCMVMLVILALDARISRRQASVGGRPSDRVRG